MENGHDPQNGAPESARVEHDLEGPLTRMKGRSVRHLPAALPLALAGVLVVATVAFGATVVKTVVNPPKPTPAVLGGEDATPTPTVAPTEAPTAEPTPTEAPTEDEEATPTPGEEATPTPGEEATPTPVVTPTEKPTPGIGSLSLSVEKLSGKVRLNWSKFEGQNFAYYKVVRSTNSSATWPLGSGDTLVAAISDRFTTTFLDSCGSGTFTYRVFAVKSSESNYSILAQSANKTVSVAAPTSAPTHNPASLGDLRVHNNGDGTYTFSWNAYTGDIDYNYYKLSGVPYPQTPGYAETGQYWTYVSPGTTSATVRVEPGTWNVNVEAIYYPDGNKTAAAKTSTLKLVVEGSTQTAPPIVSLSLSATKQDDGTVRLQWSKYTGPYFSYYGIVRTEGNAEPTLPLGSTPTVYFDNPSVTGWTDDGSAFGPLQVGHKYNYRVYAYSEESFGNVVPNCTVVTILGISRIASVTIPLPPTAAPTEAPTEAPTAAPTEAPTAAPTAHEPTPTPAS